MPGSSERADVTRLLQDWRDGREEALDRLLPLVYDELRRMARVRLGREGRRQTLRATELVHEAFLRLVNQNAGWQNRLHFYGIAATCMRRVLVDRARRRQAAKRPPSSAAVALDEAGLEAVGAGRLDTILAIDAALETLARVEPRRAQVAELKCFAGLEVGEIARLLGVSEATVGRDWTEAKRVLRELLGESGRDPR